MATKKYTKDHEWVVVDGETATVGITEHAAKELGDITFVELPDVNTDLIVGEALGVVESVKAASDIYSPVSGTVTAVNKELEESPERINESAEKDGWICKIGNVDIEEINNLMDEAQYNDFVKSQKK